MRYVQMRATRKTRPTIATPTNAVHSAEITQRLLALQRRRLTESQVVDQRTRRTLHDEILQQLHTAILTLDASRGGQEGRIDEAIGMITKVHADISGLLRKLPGASIPDFEGQGLIGALKELVRVEIQPSFDQVVWDITVGGELRVAGLSQLETEVVYFAAREALRNAARYGRDGRGEDQFTLTIKLKDDQGFCLEIEDNGVGIDTYSDPKGGGQGLSLHTTMMAVIGGELSFEQVPGEVTRVRLRVPAEIE